VQAEVLDLLRSLQAEMNMGVILVTHNFGVVADICDRVSVMRGGRVVETGPVRSIFYHSEHAYTQKLLGDILQEEEPRGPLVAPGAGNDVGANNSAANTSGAENARANRTGAQA
jgi:peptide/nickel transport system permease protein